MVHPRCLLREGGHAFAQTSAKDYVLPFFKSTAKTMSCNRYMNN